MGDNNAESCRHHCQQDSLSKTEPKILPCNFYLCNIYCNLNKSNYLFKKLNPNYMNNAAK